MKVLNKVKESKTNLLVHKFELFGMSDTETTSEMFTRSIDIVNSLKALGRDMRNTEFVNKTLQLISKELGT